MDQGLITCPECGHEFELSDVLTSQIRDTLKVEMQQEVLEREKEVKKKADALKAEREEFEQKLAQQEELVQKQVAQEVQQKLKQAEDKAAKAAEALFGDQLKELQETLDERNKSVKELKENEFALRKQKRELEEATENLELDMQRKLDEERQKIRQEAEQKSNEQHRLKDLEKEKLISDLKNDLADMTRRAEQGSMETQGEVLEQDFERRLQDFFRFDNIQPVPKGTRGADLIHMVKTIGGLAERFRMDLRSIGQLIFRIRMVMAGVRQNHILDAPLIAALIVLRLQNRKLYEEYIANPACAPDVINYLVEGMPEKFRYSNNMAIIEAYLIAGDSSLIEYKACAEMLTKYREIVDDQSLKDYEGIRYHADRVVRITDSLRGHSGGTAGSKLAFERIELISNIRA